MKKQQREKVFVTTCESGISKNGKRKTRIVRRYVGFFKEVPQPGFSVTVKKKYTVSVRFKMGKRNGVDVKNGVWALQLLGCSRLLDLSQKEAGAQARHLPQD